MTEIRLHLAVAAYGGQAQAAFLQSLRALRRACAANKVDLAIDLGGGEALLARARAGSLARFLRSKATHLVFADADRAFSAQDLLTLVASGEALSRRDNLFVLSREAAESLTADHPELIARLGDVRGGEQAPVTMLFDSMLLKDRYLGDLDALEHRWRDLSR